LVATRLSAACIALLLASSARPSPGGADSAPILVHDDPSPAEARAQAAAATCTLEPGTVASNSLWMQVEADCCGPVGVGPGPDAPGTTAISILGAPARRIRMRISVAERGPVELDVYDIAGRRVRNLLRTELDAGDRWVDWDGTSDDGERLPTGVYQVKLAAGTVRAAATAVLLQ